MSTTESSTTTTTTTTSSSPLNANTSEQQSETNTTATTTTTTNDSGANFRESEPKTQPAGETTAGETSTDKDNKDGDKAERFGMGGKNTSKVSFRILTNVSLSFKPYAGLAKKNEFCIKPGGVNGAIKPFTSSSGRKQYKKVGIRISYTIKQLLSVRDKFKTLPSELEQIEDVLVEGLGDFEALTTQTITESSQNKSKLRSRKTAKSSATQSPQQQQQQQQATTTAFEKQNAERYAGDDGQASFRKNRKSESKLKKNVNKKDDNTDIKSAEKQKTEPKIDKPRPSTSKQKVATKVDDKPKHIVNNDVDTNNQTSKPKPSSVKASTGKLSQRTGGWRSGRGGDKLDPMALLIKKITIRLNKITLDNFDTLSDQLIQIFEKEITNTEQLTKLVTLIFEKTVQEHVYGPLYAKLCVALSSKNKSFDEIIFNSDNKKEIIQVDFKNVLVKVCQTEFQKGKRDAIITDDMDETDKENEVIKQKKILLGTMKFIGQLYLKELIPSKIMTVCLKYLIGQFQSKPSEDDVEGACTLLQTVGSTLDNDPTVTKNELKKYYQKLNSIEGKSNKYSVRIRMIIQNLLDLRKNGWKSRSNVKSEGPRALKKDKDIVSGNNPRLDIFDSYDDGLPFDFETLINSQGGNDDAVVMHHVVPVKGHVVASTKNTKIKYGKSNRYSRSTSYEARSNNNKGNNTNDGRQKLILPKRQGRSGGRRQLLKTAEEEEDIKVVDEMPKYEERKVEYTKESGKIEIGQRKSRTSLSSRNNRPCTSGKSVDDDTIEELTGDYISSRANQDKFLSTLVKYKLNDNRTGFMQKFIGKAIDEGKGERLADIIPKLMNEYIILSDELDGGFIEFFKMYTQQDNPQIAMATAQLLAPLIVDNEINFIDVLEWILLDTYDKQPQDDFLKFYDGDGIRNYIKKSKTITKALELLAKLFKELKEACFTDGQYVDKLIKKYNFKIDNYINKDDLGKKDEIKTEWKNKYGLKFAF